MKRVIPVVALWLLTFGSSAEAGPSLTVLSEFNPSNAGGLCGLGFDHRERTVWVHACSGADIQRYSSAGVFLSSVSRPGESANDVDVEFAPSALTLGTTTIQTGNLLFINGETDKAEVYAVNEQTGAVRSMLASNFGASHVVGGAFHPDRLTLFLLQDRLPSAKDENRVAEIDPETGLVESTFQTTGMFDVNFGDLDVCASTGNLLIVSSVESALAEFTPEGALVRAHPLPTEVSGLSSIGIDDVAGEIWVGNTSGVVFRLGGDLCLAGVDLVPGLQPWGWMALAFLVLGAGCRAFNVQGRIRAE